MKVLRFSLCSFHEATKHWVATVKAVWSCNWKCRFWNNLEQIWSLRWRLFFCKSSKWSINLMLISCRFTVVCSWLFLQIIEHLQQLIHYCFEEFVAQAEELFVAALKQLQMSSYCGLKKVGGEWTAEERIKIASKWLKAEKQLVQKRKAEGFDLKKIAVPLPDVKNLKKYQRDGTLKKFLKPFQVINPYGLKKPFVPWSGAEM